MAETHVISALRAKRAEVSGYIHDLEKNKLREQEVTYVDLAKRLKKHGFKERNRELDHGQTERTCSVLGSGEPVMGQALLSAGD